MSDRELEVGDRVEVARETVFTHGRRYEGRQGRVTSTIRVPFPSSAVYCVWVELDPVPGVDPDEFHDEILLRVQDVKEV